MVGRGSPRGALGYIEPMTDRPVSEPDVSAEHPLSASWVWAGAHRPPVPRALVEAMREGWSPEGPTAGVHPAAGACARRRQRLGELLAGTTLVVPTGPLKVRANDTDYRFRPGTDFSYLTGCDEPDAVLVLAPGAGRAHATLFVPERRDQRSHEFFTDSRYGELWVGPRRGTREAAAHYAIATAPLEELAKHLAGLEGTAIALVRGLDPSVDALVAPSKVDARLVATLSEMRLVKDAFEREQLEAAIAATVSGFADVVRALPEALRHGERVVEGVFNLRARVAGHDVGYDTIAAAGAHASILHWTRNDGAVRPGDLLLLDAGVEGDHLYTADVTRTLPVSGTFSPAQRRIYEIVLAAQEAGIAAIRPGVPFAAAHDAATAVLVDGLVDLGLLSNADEALRRDAQLYRRYTLHGTSHMLGLDVHDCANARQDLYRGDLAEGYVLTVEPGLYFQANDLTVPEEYRGIGVRIEDDIWVGPDGAVNLSAALPRAANDVEAWMRAQWDQGPTPLRLGE